MLKRLVKLGGSLAVRAWDCVADFARALVGRRRPGRCVVLYYHEVSARERERFAAQMKQVARYATVLPANHHGALDADRDFVVITFDDGFVSVLENALPELQRYNMPATIFVPSGYLGRQPGWMKNGNKEWVMVPEQLRVARKGGLTIGSHTVQHPRLDRLPLDQAACEMAVSKAELEKILQEPIELLSFPHGAYTPAVLEHAKKIGYSRVFGIEPALVEGQLNEFLVQRVAANASDWNLEFRLKIRGAYRWLRKDSK